VSISLDSASLRHPNSPTTTYQEFVATAIELTRCKYTEAYVFNCMDNILLSHPNESILLLILADLLKDLEAWRLWIAPEKLQKKMPPF
jgi:hypothetical protein